MKKFHIYAFVGTLQEVMEKYEDELTHYGNVQMHIVDSFRIVDKMTVIFKHEKIRCCYECPHFNENTVDMLYECCLERLSRKIFPDEQEIDENCKLYI